jgi:hypothetical protein
MAPEFYIVGWTGFLGALISQQDRAAAFSFDYLTEF